jgi:hypothetical protein
LLLCAECGVFEDSGTQRALKISRDRWKSLNPLCTNPFMHGCQCIVVLIFLVSQNVWTFVLFLHCRGYILYTFCVYGLRHFALFNEIDLIIKRRV